MINQQTMFITELFRVHHDDYKVRLDSEKLAKSFT